MHTMLDTPAHSNPESSIAALAAMPQVSDSSETCTRTREWLRDATHDAHAATDAAFSRFDLASEAGLGRFLAAQAQGLAAAHSALRTNSLWADTVAARLRTLPPATATPIQVSVPLGVAYVVAGSLHGTAVLRTRYLASRPPGTTAPAFFSGSAWKPMWRDVLARLDATPPAPELLDSALKTFSAFRQAAEHNSKAAL